MSQNPEWATESEVELRDAQNSDEIIAMGRRQRDIEEVAQFLQFLPANCTITLNVHNIPMQYVDDSWKLKIIDGKNEGLGKFLTGDKEFGEIRVSLVRIKE